MSADQSSRTAVASAPEIAGAALLAPSAKRPRSAAISLSAVPNSPLKISSRNILTESARPPSVPASVLDMASMPPPKFVCPSLIRYCSIEALSFATSVVTPRNVNLTLSPCALALTPNSLRRSNSPVAASATASIMSSKLLPIAEAVSP